MASEVKTILDGSVDITASTSSFSIYNSPGSIRGINIGVDIPIEAWVAGDWEAVLDSTGTAVVLSATGSNPLVFYAVGEFRAIAGRNLGATEKVVLVQ